MVCTSFANVLLMFFLFKVRRHAGMPLVYLFFTHACMYTCIYTNTHTHTYAHTHTHTHTHTHRYGGGDLSPRSPLPANWDDRHVFSSTNYYCDTV
jgi:hypothetical protein